MRGSASSRSNSAPFRAAWHWPATAVLAVAFVAAHSPFLPQSLEDIDSINFALGLRHFDLALHQPHPPGYPLYIGLGHVSLAALSWLLPSLAALRVEAVGLAVWSPAGGGAVPRDPRRLPRRSGAPAARARHRRDGDAGGRAALFDLWRAAPQRHA